MDSESLAFTSLEMGTQAYSTMSSWLSPRDEPKASWMLDVGHALAQMNYIPALSVCDNSKEKVFMLLPGPWANNSSA